MPIDFRTIAGGPLGTNCYLIWDRESRASAVIDPGCSPNQIIYHIGKLDLDVEWVLLTHGHFDHAFYAGTLVKQYGVRVGMHESDVVQLESTLAIAESYFYDMTQFEPMTPTGMLVEGQVIELGGSRISVLHTPGHSEGGLCFVTDAGVFCGDTIFAGSIGRYDFPGGSEATLMNSIKTKLLTLDDATPLYPGHGPSTTAGVERRTNPFLA